MGGRFAPPLRDCKQDAGVVGALRIGLLFFWLLVELTLDLAVVF